MRYHTIAALLLVALHSVAFGQQGGGEDKLAQNWQVFHDRGDYDKAVEQARLIYQLGQSTKNNELMAQALNWEGQSLLKITRRQSANRNNAEKALKKSQELLASVDNKDLETSNLQLLSEIARLEEDDTALALYQKQLAAINNQIAAGEANKNLSEKVAQLGSQTQDLQQRVQSLSAAQVKAELLLAMQKNYMDSIEMARMQDAFLLEKKELELKDQKTQVALQQNQLRLQSSQRNFFIAIAGILTLFAIGIYFRFSEIKKYNIILNAKNEALIAEQQRSEMLLLNILPAMVADELKNSGITKARRYEQATVMFSDFKDFSQIAKTLPPEQLVAELDVYFKAFDFIIGKYQIEKIKTIGDAYMCVGGIPDVQGSSPKDVVKAALEIQSLLAKFKVERQKAGKPFFEARIGIHTGPLVAGVVGSKKFAYDIWGDTVNVASRLETSSEAGRVNISETTYKLVKSEFKCEARGLVAIKNLNQVAMYFVEG
ncbi:MAG: adenylate/guanylate cyclase domain-containing protein [Saprospiraceae bacterium]|nr:adenylate/guanylate cyclase domain-containing protein [Saprospiraceae bacterium]